MCIEDDCEGNDPWNSSEPLSLPNVWPRDNSGHVIFTDIGVDMLRAMHVENRRTPEMIKVRDYQIDSSNFDCCSPTTRRRDHRFGSLSQLEPDAVAALAKDIVDGIDLAILSIDMHSPTKFLPGPRNAFRCTPPASSLGGPQIREVVLNLSP